MPGKRGRKVKAAALAAQKYSGLLVSGMFQAAAMQTIAILGCMVYLKQNLSFILL